MDYDSLSTSDLEDIYFYCMLDERFDAVVELANAAVSDNDSREWFLFAAKEAAKQGILTS